MAKQTKRQRIEEKLAAYGYRLDYSTSKYNVWCRSRIEGYVFVGKSGGLRRGRTEHNSIPVDPQRWLGVS